MRHDRKKDRTDASLSEEGRKDTSQLSSVRTGVWHKRGGEVMTLQGNRTFLYIECLVSQFTSICLRALTVPFLGNYSTVSRTNLFGFQPKPLRESAPVAKLLTNSKMTLWMIESAKVERLPREARY
jgi:hypothetical protein